MVFLGTGCHRGPPAVSWQAKSAFFLGYRSNDHQHCDDVCLVRETRAAIDNEDGPGHDPFFIRNNTPSATSWERPTHRTRVRAAYFRMKASLRSPAKKIDQGSVDQSRPYSVDTDRRQVDRQRPCKSLDRRTAKAFPRSFQVERARRSPDARQTAHR